LEDGLVDFQQAHDVEVYLVEQSEDMALLGVQILEGGVILVHMLQLAVEQVVLDDRVQGPVQSNCTLDASSHLTLELIHPFSDECIIQLFLLFLPLAQSVESDLEGGVLVILGPLAREDEVADSDVLHQLERE